MDPDDQEFVDFDEYDNDDDDDDIDFDEYGDDYDDAFDYENEGNFLNPAELAEEMQVLHAGSWYAEPSSHPQSLKKDYRVPEGVDGVTAMVKRMTYVMDNLGTGMSWFQAVKDNQFVHPHDNHSACYYPMVRIKQPVDGVCFAVPHSWGDDKQRNDDTRSAFMKYMFSDQSPFAGKGLWSDEVKMVEAYDGTIWNINSHEFRFKYGFVIYDGLLKVDPRMLWLFATALRSLYEHRTHLEFWMQLVEKGADPRKAHWISHMCYVSGGQYSDQYQGHSISNGADAHGLYMALVKGDFNYKHAQPRTVAVHGLDYQYASKYLERGNFDRYGMPNGIYYNQQLEKILPKMTVDRYDPFARRYVKKNVGGFKSNEEVIEFLDKLSDDIVEQVKVNI